MKKLLIKDFGIMICLMGKGNKYITDYHIIWETSRKESNAVKADTNGTLWNIIKESSRKTRLME